MRWGHDVPSPATVSDHLRGSRGFYVESFTLERILFSLKCKSAGAIWMLGDLGGGVHLVGIHGVQLNDSLQFSKKIYLREQLKVDLRYCLSLAYCGIAMDGGQFSFAVCLGPLFT